MVTQGCDLAKVKAEFQVGKRPQAGCSLSSHHHGLRIAQADDGTMEHAYNGHAREGDKVDYGKYQPSRCDIVARVYNTTDHLSVP